MLFSGNISSCFVHFYLSIFIFSAILSLFLFDFVIRIPVLLCDQLNSEWHCCPCFVIQVRLATISGLLSLPLLCSSLYTCNHQPLPTIPPGQPPSNHQASRTPVNNNISFYRSSFNIFLIRSIIKCGCFYTCPTKLSTALAPLLLLLPCPLQCYSCMLSFVKPSSCQSQLKTL